MANSFEIVTSAHIDPPTNRKVRRVLLAGEVVFASLQGALPPSGFVSQAPRDAQGGLAVHFMKNAPKVHVSIDQRLCKIPRIRCALALDGYLAWGLGERRKGIVVLLGGAESEHSTHVSILAFSGGKVSELDEKVLPPATATYFRDALASMVGELRLKYPTAHFVQAAPLPDWALEGVEYLGEKPLRGLSFRSIALRGPSRHVAPALVYAGIGALGMSFYAAAITTGWNRYDRAVAAYGKAVADPAIEGRGGIDTGFLSVAGARRVFMESPRRQAVLVEKAEAVVRGIGSVPGVQIVEMKLLSQAVRAPQTPAAGVVEESPQQEQQRRSLAADRTADVAISLSVPRAKEPAVNQAQSVMAQIAAHTGMSLRLTHQGWREDKETRTFRIEGFFHD